MDATYFLYHGDALPTLAMAFPVASWSSPEAVAGRQRRVVTVPAHRTAQFERFIADDGDILGFARIN